MTRDLDALAAAGAAALGAWWGGVRPQAAWLLLVSIVLLIGAVVARAGRRWPDRKSTRLNSSHRT